MNTAFDKRQSATILAALRYWQREGLMSSGHEQDIATEGNSMNALDAEDIDALCEQINVPAATPIIVVGCEGGLVQGASSNIEGLSMIVLDYDTEGCDDDEITEVPQSDTVELEPAIVGLHTVAHDAPWMHQICDAVGVKGLREQINTKPAEPHITISPEAWEPTGSGDPAKPEEGDDPTSRLLASITINDREYVLVATPHGD